MPGLSTRGDPRHRTFRVGRAPGIITYMEFVLWVIAVILVVAGIIALVRGALAYGALLIIVGLLVGPGGVSLFT